MMKHFAAAALCLCSWTCLIEKSSAQDAQLTSRDIIRALQRPLDMTDFQNPMTLKEALGLFYEHVKVQGVLGKDAGLPIIVDQQSFKDANPEAGDIYESPVKFPPRPLKMTVATALQIALSQVATADTTFVIRHGTVLITTAKQQRLETRLKQTVTADFDRRPLEDAIYELAEQTGVSIQVDSRALKDKQNTQVTAVFRNDTSLRDALVMLADMIGLQVVELSSGVYVTSPSNAEALRKTAPKK
jgi:hypothetical protein